MSNCDGDLVDGLENPNNNSFAKQREKIIIDTDPGIGKNFSLFFSFLNLGVMNEFKVEIFSNFQLNFFIRL